MSDRELVSTIEASRMVRALSRGLARVNEIAETSLLVTRVRALRQWWNNESLLVRRRATGIVLFTAGSIHLVLLASVPSPGWLWLVTPVWAMIIGALLVTFSARASHEGKS